MAIAFDVATTGNRSASPLTYSHTCTGSNGLLVVNVLEASATVPTVTYNGVSMTLIDNTGFIVGIGYNYLFYLLAPATGTHSVVVTVASGAPNSISASYTGVVAVDPDAGSHSNATGTSVTAQAVNVTTTIDNDWMIGMFNFSAASITAGAGTTQRVQYSQGLTIMDSNAVIHPAGATSLNITCASQNIGAVAMSIQSQAVSKTLSLTDTSVSTDSQTTLRTKSISVSDTSVSTETLIKKPGKVFSDTSTSTDTLKRTPGIVFTDTAHGTDSLSRALTRILTELSVSTDSIDLHKKWNDRVKPTTNWSDRTPPTSTWTDRVSPP